MSKKEGSTDRGIALVELSSTAGKDPKKGSELAESMSPDRELQYYAAAGDVEGMRKAFQAGGKINVPFLGEPEGETEKGKEKEKKKRERRGDHAKSPHYG